MTLERWLEKTETSQAELARRAGVTQGAISRLVAGTRHPTLAMALAIRDATGGKVTVDSWPKVDHGEAA